ncbi:MFS transporter, OFA family, oxalate/formate antiporter [Entomortierella parvispora]|uniref:MFS transporter, OFA family, oxalate/formate antiporter n=1 Tax=Entomortierella parvispora TaxID=205924 RepID=A0A9P3H3U0_9FUNG|nr:MFS transporter, OFA family, oxalate/formate antiporter [Entomortierella parvispora]
MSTPSESSNPMVRAIHRHYSDTNYHRSLRTIESEKYLIFNVPFNRWTMFPTAFIFQAICGSLYAWSVFNDPIDGYIYGLVTNPATGKAAPPSHNAAITFYIAVGCFGISSAINGPWLERNGPKLAAILGATVFFLGNMIAAIGIYAKIMALLYFGYGVLGGAGLGLCYISPVSALQKWFPDHRGLAAGFAVCGFGAGSIILAKIPQPLIEAVGLPLTFVVLGCCYFVAMLFCAFVFRVPPPGFQVNGMDMYRNKVPANGEAPAEVDAEAHANEKAAQDYKDPGVNMVLSSAIFSKEYRIMYVMFFGNSIAGLVVLSRLANIVMDIFGKDGATAATIVAINGGFNLGGRLFFSTVSDKLGRKNSFFVMLLSQVVILATLPVIMERQVYWAFLLVIWILTACYGGGFGCIPAFLCDMFGPSNIGALHGIILTAWSLAGVGGGLLFTQIYNQLLLTGYTVKDAVVYSANLHWILAVACVGFLFLLFVGTNIHDRLLPQVKGEFMRLRIFGRLVRIGTFGVRWVSPEEEASEWEAYVDSRHKEASRPPIIDGAV